MDVLTGAVYDALAGDATLQGLLADYNGAAAVSTVDPAPGDMTRPYIVTAGQVSDAGWDTKTSRGRDLRRDLRCYDDRTGSAARVEAIAERVREMFHRQPLVVVGFGVVVAECFGPVKADEPEAYGRVVTCHWKMEQTEE